MDILPLFIFLTIAFGGATLYFFATSKKMRAQLTSIKGNVEYLQGKIHDLKHNLTGAKDKAKKHASSLEEARSELRKKRRRSAGSESHIDEAGMAMISNDTMNVIATLKKQIHDLKDQNQKAQKTIHNTLLASHESAQKDLLAKNKHLENQNLILLGKRKASIKNLSTDLEQLPEDVIIELSRLVRKSEQFENLYSFAHGKLKLSQEKFTELQKRYFAVCREIALITGVEKAGMSDDSARAAAEKLVKNVESKEPMISSDEVMVHREKEKAPSSEPKLAIQDSGNTASPDHNDSAMTVKK